MASIFGQTVQLYITQACEMGCQHCSSRTQEMPNMSFQTLEKTVDVLRANGVGRVELFANDPLLHPQIKEFVDLLNGSGLEYAILTVGASPKNPDVRKRFWEVLELVDPTRGAFVFSVDHTLESSTDIIRRVRDDISYAFKAWTFWEMAPFLRARQIPVRTNTVISSQNIKEVPAIISRVASMGFSASFCFAQHRQPEFNKLLSEGFTPGLGRGFRDFLHTTFLGTPQIEKIVNEARAIVNAGQFGSFNTFRGNESGEIDIELEQLDYLRERILDLKVNFGGEKVLPGAEFINGLGNRGFGCRELLNQGQFPQIKVGAKGQMLFCCDLHDPITQQFNITDLVDPYRQLSFLEMARANPYIWLCAYYNPCDFSINHVRYSASVDSIGQIRKQDLPLTVEKLAHVKQFCTSQIGVKNVVVLGQIPTVLRRDWLDMSLPAADRGNKHVGVDPVEWRSELEGACERVIKTYIRSGHGHNGKIAALLMWRGALAFHKSLAACGIRQCHIDVKRDERTLKVDERMPLSPLDRQVLSTLKRDGQVLIPDPMLASGSSATYAIELIMGFGLRENQIAVLCVVAAPEGVFNVSKQFPGVRIIAATIDDCLNSDAYIKPGLGDAGEKYFCENSLNNFSKDMFTDAQWAHLKTYFDCQG